MGTHNICFLEKKKKISTIFVDMIVAGYYGITLAVHVFLCPCCMSVCLYFHFWKIT